jgi:methanogenic corrinoid protein MtbC1
VPGVSTSSCVSIRDSLDALVDDVMLRQWQVWPELQARLSPGQIKQMRGDTLSHLEFLATALCFDERPLLDDYLVWCKVLFTNLGMPVEWLSGSFGCIADAVADALPPEEADIAQQFIAEALVVFAEADTVTVSELDADDELGRLAREYLHAVLHFERARAVRMVVDSVAAGASVRDIYLRVLGPTQREVGRLWHANEISVAKEHYVTAVTQASMAHLYERVFSGESFSRTVVVAAVSDEQHELGARMVADFFEIDGWNMHYLGANTPAHAIVQAVHETGADVLALSATLTPNVGEVAEVIALLRANPETRATQALVGGYPFNLAPELWRDVGADGYAADAGGASAMAAELVDRLREARLRAPAEG